MAKQSFEQATERFMGGLIELREMIDAFEARTAADNCADESEMLMTIEALGRAGARLYNAQKAMAEGGPFSLHDVVRGMRRDQHT